MPASRPAAGTPRRVSWERVGDPRLPARTGDHTPAWRRGVHREYIGTLAGGTAGAGVAGALRAKKNALPIGQSRRFERDNGGTGEASLRRAGGLRRAERAGVLLR